MAKSVFNATLEPNNRIDVNAFDLSHVYHGTFDMGIVYPVMWHRFPPKSSGRINIEAGLQQFQTVFPLQTSQRVRFNVHKVELRALDEDFMERTVGNSETLEPYLGVNTATLYTTGSLADYLGLATTGYEIDTSSLSPLSSTATNFITSFEVGSVIQLSSLSPLNMCSLKFSISPGTFSYVSPLISSLKTLDFIFTRYNEHDKNTYVVAVHQVPVMQNVSLEAPAGVTSLYVQFSDGGLISASDLSIYKNAPYKIVDLSKDSIYRTKGSEPSAYPFRTYEAIYNSFYRDTRNNPRLVNGKPVYNRWIHTNASGEDNSFYGLERSAWMPDAFTTAVPDPQQGIKAPLAGLTTYTQQALNEHGEVESRVATALIDEDGKAYGLDFKSNEDGTALSEVTYTELGNDPTITSIQSIADLAQQGISIETLRNINAYQKYLELNMRKGYLYKDIIQGRWDVNIKYDELLMPEYLGGMSRELNTRAVTQTVDNSTDGSYADSLGNQAGISGVYGNMEGNVEFFCDEESIIMVTMTIVPMPIYSQFTSKQWWYREPLDSFNPEFDNIGFQPVYRRELIPTKDGENEVLNNGIFGYQRPWYEYLWKPDTAHGDFRASLRNFLMMRHFIDMPALNSSFLLVDREQVNDVYAVNKIDGVPINDHFFGYVRFNFTARLPITRVAIPRLD